MLNIGRVDGHWECRGQQEAGCVVCGEEGEVATTAAGRIASVYYLQHTTMAFFAQRLGPDMDLKVGRL